VKTTIPASSGSFKNWESETYRLLSGYEREVGVRLPRGELTSRVFQRLSRATITDIHHLQRLIPRVVRQALVDYGREQSRDSERFVYDYAFDFPTPPNGSPDVIEDHKELLLGDNSPLDDFERAMIQVALEDPARFIRHDGQPAQSALARYFRVDQVTIRNRWIKIMEKAMTLQSTPDLSI
jgi:hypothetical protein